MRVFTGRVLWDPRTRVPVLTSTCPVRVPFMGQVPEEYLFRVGRSRNGRR